MTTRYLRKPSLQLTLESNHEKLTTGAQSDHYAVLITTRFIRNLSIRLKLKSNHDKLATCALTVREAILMTSAIYSQTVPTTKAGK